VIARAQTEKNALIEEIRAGELKDEIDEADPAADAEQHALGKRLAGVWSGHALMRQNVLHGGSLAVMPAELSVAFKFHRGLLLWRGRMLKSMLKGTGGMLKRSQQLLPELGRIAALDHEIMCVVEYEKIAHRRRDICDQLLVRRDARLQIQRAQIERAGLAVELDVEAPNQTVAVQDRQAEVPPDALRRGHIRFAPLGEAEDHLVRARRRRQAGGRAAERRAPSR